MRPDTIIQCSSFPCAGARHDCYIVPDIEVEPETISVMLISECAPELRNDYYYSGNSALFSQTTLQAFQDAGLEASSIEELVAKGIYLTSAVKCGKSGYAIESKTVENCSHLLQQELALFPNVQVYLLMGDVAIKAFNMVAKRTGEGRVIPAGATYKIRKGQFTFKGKRVFPSYLQAGPSFNIEKSKRRMIAEDLAAALAIVNIA